MDAADTDWGQIVQLYDQLMTIAPSPVVELNRAIAVAELAGPEAGLEALAGLPLDHYQPFHSTRADLLRRAGRTGEALEAVTGLSKAELEPLLDSLLRKEVLGLQTDPSSPEHGQYGFLQDLVRIVAYETLARGQRKARHLAAADQLAATHGEEEIAQTVEAARGLNSSTAA